MHNGMKTDQRQVTRQINDKLHYKKVILIVEACNLSS